MTNLLHPNELPKLTLFEKMISERPYEIIDYPRRDKNGHPIGKVAIRPLTNGEMLEAKTYAKRDVDAHCKKFGIAATKDDPDDFYNDVYNEFLSAQVLFRALRDPDNIDKPAVPSPEVFMGSSKDSVIRLEVAALMANYTYVEAYYSPTHLGDLEVEQMANELIQGAPSFLLQNLTSETKTRLIGTLVSRIQDFNSDTSSHGESSDEQKRNGNDSPTETNQSQQTNLEPPVLKDSKAKKPSKK